jgi:hypothetical protein
VREQGQFKYDRRSELSDAKASNEVRQREQVDLFKTKVK